MATQQIPAVQLPVGAVPNPQAGASQDTLKKMKLIRLIKKQSPTLF